MKAKKITPLLDNVLIEPQEKESKTKSGLLLPDTAREKPLIGKVLAVGKGKKIPIKEGELLTSVRFVPAEIKIGQVVLYKKWSGTEQKIDGKELVIVKEEDVLAVIE